MTLTLVFGLAFVDSSGHKYRDSLICFPCTVPVNVTINETETINKINQYRNSARPNNKYFLTLTASLIN